MLQKMHKSYKFLEKIAFPASKNLTAAKKNNLNAKNDTIAHNEASLF